MFKELREEVTYFGGHHRDVVPFGHFSVEGFQCCDGAVHRLYVKQPFQIRVSVNGISARGTQTSLATVDLKKRS